MPGDARSWPEPSDDRGPRWCTARRRRRPTAARAGVDERGGGRGAAGTAGDKAIPVTPEAVRAHRRGGWDALLMAAERVGGAVLLGGPMLMLGGSTALQPTAAGALIGDLSGVMATRLPPGLRRRYSPGPAIARIPDWETRIAAAAELVAHQDLRLLAGMPSWILILLEHVARDRADLAGSLALWPNLRAFIHGGVSFAPYRRVFEARLGRRLECIEVYPALEGFVAVQTECDGGLTLMLDYGIFYEFVPIEDLGHPKPRRHTVAETSSSTAPTRSCSRPPPASGRTSWATPSGSPPATRCAWSSPAARVTS